MHELGKNVVSSYRMFMKFCRLFCLIFEDCVSLFNGGFVMFKLHKFDLENGR